MSSRVPMTNVVLNSASDLNILMQWHLGKMLRIHYSRFAVGYMQSFNSRTDFPKKDVLKPNLITFLPWADFNFQWSQTPRCCSGDSVNSVSARGQNTVSIGEDLLEIHALMATSYLTKN